MARLGTALGAAGLVARITDVERPSSVEQVRDELRRLGYLDSGLDRFVLAGARTSSRLAASLRVAFRVGLAGAVVFGSVATVAAVGLDPRLLGEPGDLAVLSVYLVWAAGLATSVAAFLGGLAAGWMGRRPGADLSRNVGVAVALVGLSYFGLWWRSHAAGAAFAVQLAAGALGILCSLVLGRFGSLAAVAVLAAEGADRLPQASFSRRRLLPLVVSAGVLVGAGVAAGSYLVSSGAPDPPDFAVVPTGLHVRVLGIDGLESRMAAQMIKRGEMPRLQALLARAAHARLSAELEQVPAIVWTTIATGRGPEAHGIVSTGGRRLAGMRRPFALGEGRLGTALASATDLLRITRPQPPTALLRSVKAFWNVASEKGLRVGVVNWWATWPADPVNGYVVSDRAFFKLEKGGPIDREVHPLSAVEELRALMPPPSEPAPRRLDRFHAAAARRMRDSAAPDVEAVYLQGLDVLTMQQIGEESGASLADLDARLESVRAHHRFLDEVLGTLIDDVGPQDVIVLVGDPGRLPRRDGQRPFGLLALIGGPIRALDLGEASERDVAPTVLHLAGLPVSRELSGRVLEASLEPGFRQSHPVRMVPAYGRRAEARPAESAFDRDMLEELRSLGYIR
jgi:Type I phosphodiesterase / nucleotide pyrophosphatase